MLVNKGFVNIDQKVTARMSDLFVPCMIVVYKHVYVYWVVRDFWALGGKDSVTSP